MGIKHFFNWFKTNFKNNIKNMRAGSTVNSTGVSIDNLMIDLNGIFHSSTQKVYEYGSHKPKSRLLSQPLTRQRYNDSKTQLRVFEDVCMNIESLLVLVKPNKRLILCIDGPAPLSKQNQQRQRRFRSANEKDGNELNNFDSNCITPGTKFMDSLSEYIDWYIRKSVSDNPSWREIEVVFSNEKSPGEGEHKIINYIRFYGNPTDSFCIHGLDADLIMLSLGTHLPYFWVIREDLYDKTNKFFLIDIGKTRTDLSKLMDWNNGIKHTDRKTLFNHEYAINDFIFLCFMVGNDFLPHIPSLEIMEGGIDQMLYVYKNVGRGYGHITLNADGNVIFDKRSLKVFLGTISTYDKNILENKLSKKHEFFPDLLLESNAVYDKGRYILDIEKYRKEYYIKSFNGFDNIKDLCHQYFIGMQWVLSYYTRGVPDWKWCFKHHYAPFAYELAEHVTDFNFPLKRETSPATPFQQLLSVLPPKSSSLIPVPLSQLLTDSSSRIKKFCPSKFLIDLSGKRKEWEGLVLLPMVDFDIINEEYFKHIGKVSSEDLKRNILTGSVLYKHSPDVSSNYESIYGNIHSCKITVNNIEL
jgi:5'-3' exonuclease